MAIGENARDVVLALAKALNDEDLDQARRYVSKDLSFSGVLGSRQGADAYFEDMKHMRLKYDVKKVFFDDTDVCLFYDLTMSGTTVFVSAWYKVEDGKVQSLRVVFDPRLLLASKAA